ncbi:MAG: outer membrane protein transport protein [Rhodospirillales bacterium]|nr:outer membrane protein transport protein [Rhodospirillales bacterium]
MSIKNINKIFVSAAVIAGGMAVFAPDAQATNGYFVYGVGPTSKGMAGAGAAYSNDALAAATNVAGMAFVGKRADFDITFFNPNREFNGRGGATLSGDRVNSTASLFEIPNFGMNYPIDDKWAVGFSLNANGGMNTEYRESVFRNFNGSTTPFSGTAPTGVDLAVATAALTFSYKVTPNVAIAFAPTGTFSRFKAYGLGNFKAISADSSHVTNRGYEQSGGYGFRAGIQAKIDDYWSVGLGYQSRQYMQPFNKYRGLFAEQGDFDIPQMANFGIALRATPKLTIAADWQWINYNQVDAIANSAGKPLSTMLGVSTSTFLLGNDEGIGFGWEDMNVFKLGANYQYSDKLTLMAGISHNDRNPFDSDQIMFNILAPGVVRTHATVGLVYNFTENASLNLAYARAFSETFTGTDPNLGTQKIALTMDQHEATVGFTYKW